MILKDKKILIIGGTGSLGQSLVKHLYKNNQLCVLSRDETKQWLMQNKYLGNQNINYFICDIRDYEALKKAILHIKPEIIINASAIKQIPICETFPFESVKTNIIGIENLIRICTHSYDPEVVLGISTDKACRPINVYGMCKAIGERLYLSAKNTNGNHTKFLCVRYGNVLESRGSIIPLFKYHAKTDKIYYLTHPEMTRFFISLDESVQLIIDAILLGEKGDIFVPIVKSGRIKDLIEIFVEKYGGRQEIIGIRSGEKIHEELINEDESRRIYSLNNRYLIIKPTAISAQRKYSSDMYLLTKDQLKDYLEKNNVFDKDFETYKEDEVRF